MGYETKLIIGKKTDMKELQNEGANFVIEIASIDLCKSDFSDTQLNKEEDTELVYIYGSDGNTEITKDEYGSKLYAIEPKKVLRFMQNANKTAKYRRYNAAIPLLKSLIKDFEGENLTCILYGH
jgi:hypothetical protein